ncbi:hypothetical protein DUNSADRAFT_18436 [Dunaliella salina]|uniref:Uncharacterized protein n=1 Tax=Dunaliella salina TaxID=3046 RepID=A0ABQ7G044_DUNSA|nr:hypothetical protein DUNSADRAFT_18436 [Dunaliella salina]|eukprot:KAF5827976.1 hypothetical protein DUNSADRAFT_18436 [Dunaliella salina]
MYKKFMGDFDATTTNPPPRASRASGSRDYSGQPPPLKGDSGKRRQAEQHEEAEQAEGLEEAEQLEEAEEAGHVRSEHAERSRRLAEAWELRKPQMQESYLQSSRDRALMKRSVNEVEMLSLQHKLYEVHSLHSCVSSPSSAASPATPLGFVSRQLVSVTDCLGKSREHLARAAEELKRMHDSDCAGSCPSCPCPSPLHLNETRKAKYIGLNACGYVFVPEWRCNTCDTVIRPDFTSLGLFPGTWLELFIFVICANGVPVRYCRMVRFMGTEMLGILLKALPIFYLLAVISFDSKSSNLFWHWYIQACV